MASATAFTGAKIQAGRAQRITASRTRSATVCKAGSEPSSRRQLLGFGFLLAAAAVAPAAKADLVADLLAKTEANKADNDKKRLLSSYANLQRSRTVQDGTCAVPYNFLGCGENPAFLKVKFISDDAESQCSGKEYGKCASGWK